MEEKNLIDNALANRLQLWGFENDVMIYSDCSLGCMLEIAPIDISCATNASVNQLKIQLVNFLNSLPENLSIQFLQNVTTGQGDILSAHERLARKDSHPLYQQMTTERLSHFQELDSKGLIPKQEIYVIVRSGLSRKLKSKSGFNWFNKRKKTPLEELQEILASYLKK